MGFQVAFESENAFAQSNVSRWMEQQQKKRDGPVRCVDLCEERRASEHRRSAEPEVVHGSVPAR